MRVLKLFAFCAVAATMLTGFSGARAQISINIGPAPVCPYGYYDFAPYNCAPYGYYGPDWFTGGVFIGAGPWYHGHGKFYGHVDNRYDPRHGYDGPYPPRGSKPFTHFEANEAHDPQGHPGNAGHDGGGEHNPGYSGGGHPGGHESSGAHH